MNILRSPTRSDIPIERSGSQPNLVATERTASFPDLSSIAFRAKRKHPGEDEVKTQLDDIQRQMADMMTLLSSSINSQAESATKITNDIATIKEQILDIKTGMGLTEKKIENIESEQKEIKTEMQTLKNSTQAVDGKIASLESDLLKLKMSSNETGVLYNDLLAELSEQNLRKKNILMAGIQEPQSTSPKERHDFDRQVVIKNLTQILENCPEPIKLMRVGKYKQNENRPIKICFASEETVKSIMRKRNDMKLDTVKIFSDQTPYQKTQYKNLRDELNRRVANGEDNLRIKYIKGAPRIVNNTPKKSQ